MSKFFQHSSETQVSGRYGLAVTQPPARRFDGARVAERLVAREEALTAEQAAALASWSEPTFTQGGIPCGRAR